jgi:urea carboxylase
MRALGLKHRAREIALLESAPLLPGTGLLTDGAHALLEAEWCGFPAILKSTAGGGGIGLRVCRNATELAENYAVVARLGATNFGQGGVYLERYVEKARHIEVQIFGDGRGNVLALGERDCSAQRRHQKVIEETPAPGLSAAVRRRLRETSEQLARAVRYRSAGTVEFLYDSDREDFFFLEVNTRLQVEHGVTEQVTGIDIVEWMVRLGSGDLPPLESLRREPAGAAIQVRIYAEDAAHGFRPSTGLLTEVRFPAGVRCDTWVENGTEVTPFYDPLLAKIIVHGETRKDAVARMESALAAARLAGVETNLDYLRQVISEPEFRAGGYPTSFLSRVHYHPRAFEVIECGMQTTVQDYPGRTGFWRVGVPPSGPMDTLAFRLANRLVGNPESAAGLECTMTGPTLRAHADAVVALAGADMGATLNGAPAPYWSAFDVPAGSELRLGAAAGPGSRAYIAIRGGIDVPEYLGSRSTFILGRFGGHAGRVLQTSDMLRWHEPEGQRAALQSVPAIVRPQYSSKWEIGVLYGPHGSPDFFTDEDIETLFAASWKVHYNSDRTGVRLIGPRPKWARKDGGEAGLHPSNLHDNAYSIGAMDFTGDMPILLGPDGPSLGGFVCPAVIAQAELWKIGQLRAGDTVRFRRLTNARATRMERELDAAISSLEGRLPPPSDDVREPAVLHSSGTTVYRASGDRYLLVETGPNELDLNLRFRVHALERRLRDERLNGIVDITPGIRSLQIHYDSRLLRRESLIESLDACDHDSNAHRAPPALLGGSGDAAGHSQIHAVGARRRALVPEQHRIHPADQRPRFNRRRPQHRLQRELPRARAWRCVSRRAGSDAGRSAGSPRHHEVQSGPNVDGRKLRRDRRRLPVRVRHGRARRVPVRRPDGPDVEHAPDDKRVRAWLAMAAAVLRSDPVLPGRRRRAKGHARRFSAREIRHRHRADGVRSPELSRVPPFDRPRDP